MKLFQNIYESFFDHLKTVYDLTSPPVFEFSRTESLFDTWDGAPQNWSQNEMVQPNATGVESETDSADSTLSSAPLPSIMQSSTSATVETAPTCTQQQVAEFHPTTRTYHPTCTACSYYFQRNRTHAFRNVLRKRHLNRLGC